MPNPPASQAAENLLSLARTIQSLKRIPRTGWLQRGVPFGEVENVAAHTSGVSLIALALAETLAEPIDRGRLLSLCLLHDLAETVLSDLPAPAMRYFAPGAKHQAEAQALADLLAGLPFAGDWLALWQEFEAAVTVESRLARDADRLDMLLQAAAYEESGRRGLDDFWERATDEGVWRFPQSAVLACRLLQARPQRLDGQVAAPLAASQDGPA